MKLGLLCFSLICACSSSPSAPTSPNNAQDAQSDAGSDDTGSDVTTTDAVSGDPLDAQRDVSVVSNSAIARIHHVEPRFGIAEYEWSDPQLRYENAVPFHTVWVPSQGAASIDALAIAGNWTFKVEPDNGGFLWSRADALFGANLYATVVEFNPDEVRVVALEVSPNGTDVTIDFEDPRISLPDANDSNTFAVFHYTAFSAASIPSPGAFLVRTYVGPNGVTVSNTRSDGGIEGILYIVHAMNGAFTTTHEESDSDLEFDLSRTPLDSSLVFYTESIDQTGFNATEFSLGCATQGNTLECGFGPPDNSGNNITISVQAVTFPDLNVTREQATLDGAGSANTITLGLSDSYVIPTSLTTPGFDRCSAPGAFAVTACNIASTIDANGDLYYRRGAFPNEFFSTTEVQLIEIPGL